MWPEDSKWNLKWILRPLSEIWALWTVNTVIWIKIYFRRWKLCTLADVLQFLSETKCEITEFSCWHSRTRQQKKEFRPTFIPPLTSTCWSHIVFQERSLIVETPGGDLEFFVLISRGPWGCELSHLGAFLVSVLYYFY